MWLDRVATRAAGYGELRARPSRLQSQHAPSGALSTATGFQPGQPVYPTFDGSSAITRGYERTAYAYRCIEKTAGSIAGQAFKAGNAKSRTARDSAPLAQLLGPAPGGPNPVFSARQLWKYSIAQWQVLGKFAWLLEFERPNDTSSRVVGLWPLQAQYLFPIMAKEGSAAPDYFAGYEYQVQGDRQWRKTFSLDQVAYFWNPSLSDVRQPESPVRIASRDIDVMRLLAEFDTAFLSNGGVPAHLITTAPFADGKERRAFRNQFRNTFGGVANAFKAMFMERELEPGEGPAGAIPDTVTVQKLAQTQRDSEMSVMRDGKIQDLCVALGVPLSILGDTTRSKYTNGATDRQNFWENNADIMDALEDMVNRRLAPRLSADDVGWFERTDIPELRPAPKFTPDGKEVAARLVTVDEWRADRGLGPLTEAQKAELHPEPAVQPPMPPASVQGKDQPVPDAKAQPGGPDPMPVGGKVTAISSARSVREPLLATVRGQIATLFADQELEIRARLAGKRGGRKRAAAEQSLALAYDREHWARRAAATLSPALMALGMTNGEATEYSEDITEGVLGELTLIGAGDPAGAFDVSIAMDTLESYLSAVPVQAVHQALLGLHTGTVTAEQAIQSLGG